MQDADSLRRIVTGCSISAALEAVGERWSFLILRGAFNGLSHFEQFQSTLGIARNILANRLARLVAHGILERCPCQDDRRKVEYRLTEKGEALLPTLVSLRQWGKHWGGGGPCNTQLVDTRDGLPVREIAVLAADGRPLKAAELSWLATDEEATGMSGEADFAPPPRQAAAG
ncbi:MAG TPA: helix-turn-helix domain-containing protein [Sphingomonas sp.]|nr:helix-turn-helix domain-containing protein [Sphingomonas sp.]